MDNERGVLFAILARQVGFVSRDDLYKALTIWSADEHTSLGDILLGRGTLSGERRDLLERLVEEHLQRSHIDANETLSTIPGAAALRAELAQIFAPFRGATLGPRDITLRAAAEGDSPESTGAPSPATALRFTRLRPHAHGGVGEVFVAHDEELNRDVALKRIRGERLDTPENRSRFILEAEVTGGLEHPGIVPIYSLGASDDGRPFYAMRFISGGSLKEAIQRFHSANAAGREESERLLDLRKLLSRFIDVCNTIEYAHSRGVLHRDLKPTTSCSETMERPWSSIGGWPNRLAPSTNRSLWAKRATKASLAMATGAVQASRRYAPRGPVARALRKPAGPSERPPI